MTKKSDAPAIRFKGFSDAWEQRKFDEVFDCTVPNNTLSRAELSYDEGTVLNVHYGDVLIKYGSVLDVQKDDIPRIPHRCREDFNGALLQDGDVIIADTAEDETTGKACEIGNLQGSAIVSGLHTMVCRPRNRMALGYLGYYLNSNAYHHQLLPLMQGIKVLSLSRSNIQKTSVSYPIAVKEQQLIAYYFSQLDNLITLHQRQPFLHSTPDISLSVRLIHPFYTSSWEQRKVGEVSESYSGGTPSVGVKEYYGGQIPFIRSAEINSEITELFLTEEGLKNSSARLVAVGDILYALYGATSGEVGRARLKGAINQAILAIKPHTDYDSEYLAQWLRKSKHSIIETYLQGGQGNLSGTIVKELSVDFPSLKEQKAIGDFFRQLDNLITLHQRKGKAAVSGCFLNCFSLEKSSAQSRTLELFGQISNQEIKYIIDGLSILGGKLRNFCVKLIILLSYTRINDIAKYHISRNTECVHNIN